jgi:hypothetical protein
MVALRSSVQSRLKSINETMARLYFPGSPIGRHFDVGDGNPPALPYDFEVIGVVRDAKYVSLAEAPQPAAYYIYSQFSACFATIRSSLLWR